MESQTIPCPNCQTVNPAKNLFCQSCGKPLLPQPFKPVETVSANMDLPPFESPVNLSKPAPAANQSPSTIAYDPFPAPANVAAGIPPQSYPPQSYPPQNIPSQGNFSPQGFAAQQGLPPQGGYPPQAAPQQGYLPQGYPPPMPTQGYSPQGLPPQGYAQQSMPPQQQAYYPPPPLPVAPTIERLGARVDGWMDLVAGEAQKADEIEKAFVEELKAREIALVNIDRMEFSAGFGKKAYQVAHHPAGSVAVSVNAAGKDLVCSWALYVQQVPNWKMMGILAGIAFGVSFLTALGSVGNFGFFFVQWVFGTFGWLWQVAVLALIAGQVWKGSWWHFFVMGSPDSAKESLAALVLAVHQCLLAAVEKSGLDVSQLRGK